MKINKNSLIGLFGATALVAGVVFQALPMQVASANQITSRSLTLQAGAADGGSKPGGTVNHLFNFTLPSVGNANVGSIKFEYCTLAAGACVTPAGLVTTGVTMGSENGATGFTNIDVATNGAPWISRAAPAAVTAGTPVAYQLLGVVNPTTPNQTFFVRITTYDAIDLNLTTGVAIDTGTVAASTTQQIVLSGTMPESLVFCTGATITTTLGVPDCLTATPGVISFDQLFSPIDTAAASSQMVASTNAGTGYSITVNGPTLTSGANTIVPMTATNNGIRGNSQFGLNLKANTAHPTGATTTAIGTEVAPASNGTNYRGAAQGVYGTVDQFKFASGDSIAQSDNGAGPGSLGGSDAQIFTVTYIANVPGSQPAGTYTTTLTYICTPTF